MTDQLNGLVGDDFVPRTGSLEDRIPVLEKEMHGVQRTLTQVNMLLAAGDERDAKMLSSLKDLLTRRQQSQSTVQVLGILAATAVVLVGMALKAPSEALIALVGAVAATAWKAQAHAADSAVSPRKDGET